MVKEDSMSVEREKNLIDRCKQKAKTDEEARLLTEILNTKNIEFLGSLASDNAVLSIYRCAAVETLVKLGPIPETAHLLWNLKDENQTDDEDLRAIASICWRSLNKKVRTDVEWQAKLGKGATRTGGAPIKRTGRPVEHAPSRADWIMSLRD
jgi:hypothetical protein